MLKLLSNLLDDFRATIETIMAEMAGMKMLKILEPKAFNGNCYAKELENFIFDMEQYFKANGTNSEETKVTLASMNLSDDAKL
ncbi:uncharacterized protein E5676_scaffold349G00020 [Cucumis melo var. makuwa]|uniref:Uncharacterized protein n=1 Tax=Cucumis melo var. makuwa TaxID=1194695 RepID=A0A5D3E2R0_CUCMM|nr:uncharacterized protein E6C27_scaffold56G002210 [Cucumis melo var. makuwa]TYK30403.1 uncharacterized protein E5676_scaffold349G00020 [Cucumis melo var. makuwa]